MKILVNGQVCAPAEAQVSVTDRGFTLGDGLFETIKVVDGRPLRLDGHWRRLGDGAALLRLSLPFDRSGLEHMIASVLNANTLETAALRLTVSRGPGQRGLLPPDPATPTVVLSATPLPPAPGPVRAVVAQSVHRNAHSPLARIKALSYLDNVLARLEAAERGADEAVLLNTAGRVAETTIANLFAVLADGSVVTPPVAEGALPGVRRADLMKALAAVERPLELDELIAAREIWLTNALSVRALVTLDGRPVGDGAPGPLTRRVMDDMDQI